MNNLILTGTPGVGKTTLIKECAYPHADQVGGFFTEELRDGSERKGFVVKTFDGRSAVLAMKGLKSRHRLNKYGVDLRAIEETAVPSALAALSEKRVVVVDEIGPMELLSERFGEMIARVLADPKPLLATIRLRAEPFTTPIRRMSDTALVPLERSRFTEVKQLVGRWLEEKCRAA